MINLKLLLFISSILLGSISLAWGEHVACTYVAENPTSFEKNLLGHVEYGKTFTISQQADDQKYGNDLKKKDFFKKWSGTSGLVAQLNQIHDKVPEFADHLVLGASSFRFVLKKLTTDDPLSDTAFCQGVKSPLSQTSDFVLQAAAVLDRDQKTVLIDREIFNSLSPSDQVGLVLNLLINSYLSDDIERAASNSAPDFAVEFQFVVRMVSAMAMDPAVSEDDLANYLNESFSGRTKNMKQLGTFRWKSPHDNECYRHESMYIKECLIEADPFYENPTVVQGIKLIKQYITSSSLKQIESNCATLEKPYADTLKQVMGDLNIMNRQMFKWLGSNDIAKVCANRPYGAQSLTMRGFIFEPDYEFCEGYSYQRTQVVDGSLMNGGYGVYRSGGASLGGGQYSKISQVTDHAQQRSVQFEWGNYIDWPRFKNSTQQLRQQYSALSENQFRCAVDINKAYFLRSIGGAD